MSSSMETQQNLKHEEEEEEDFLLATQLATGSIFYMAMQVAIELDLFAIIAKSGSNAQLSPKDIASQLPTQNPSVASMLDRILRLLTSYSILKSSLITRENGLVERLYALGSVCKYFVPNEDGVTMSALMLLVQDKVLMDSWCHMKDAILYGGIPFSKAHGMHIFELPEKDIRFNGVLNRAMFNHTTLIIKNVLEVYSGFEDLKVLVDVGGGVGTTINLITTKYPTIKGINFDLPHVIEDAPSYSGVENVGGNMFETIPTGEAMFMKWILHDWNGEDCINLLKNCHKALPDNGKVIVMEVVVPVAAENDTSSRVVSQYDIIMLTQSPGGKERTEEEFNTLAKAAGFAYMTKVCSVCNFCIIEFSKSYT